VETHALDPASVGIHAFQPPSGRMHDRLSGLKDPPGEQEGQPADGIDLVILFRREARIDHLLQLLEL
jgi:hypothetical protein